MMAPIRRTSSASIRSMGRRNVGVRSACRRISMRTNRPGVIAGRSQEQLERPGDPLVTAGRLGVPVRSEGRCGCAQRLEVVLKLPAQHARHNSSLVEKFE